MKKRAAATVLWFYTGWFVGAIVAFATGLSPVLGPVLGTAAAAIIAVDPRHMIWSQSTMRPVQRTRQVHNAA